MRERKTISTDPQTDYEKAEADLLKETLKESYKDRFLRKTGLSRIQKTMEKAFVDHWSSHNAGVEQKNIIDRLIPGRGTVSPDDPPPSR